MKKGLIYLVVFSVLFLSMCGCAQSDDAALQTTSQTETIIKTDTLTKQERAPIYKDYCAQYPQFADFASDTTELYWTIDATDEASGQKVAAIHCENEEKYYLLQVGNTFWRYNYSENYADVASRFYTFSVNSETFYAFKMCRYFSTGGFYVEDLLLVSPNRPNQIYSVTVENAYDTVASKMQIAYNKDTQKLTVKDSKKTTILPLPNKKTITYYDGVTVEKELQFTDLYVQTSYDESNEKYCWSYEIDDGTIYIQIIVFANYCLADDTYIGYWDYHEEYEGIGKVRAQILFDGENISFGDAVFTPY